MNEFACRAAIRDLRSAWLDLDIGGQQARLHYLDEASREGAPEGSPVFMLHGNPTWSFHWRHLIPPVSQSRRVIAPDWIGCGLSEKPRAADWSFTLERRVAELDALIDALGFDRVTFIAHDWGGMIASSWATRHCERVERLVLLNTSAFPLPEGKPVMPELRLARTPLLGALLVRGLNLFVRGTVERCAIRGLDDEAVAGYKAPYDSWANRLAVHRFVTDIPLGPAHPTWEYVHATAAGLSKLTQVPKLILFGLQDFIFDRDFYAEWQRRCPEAEFEAFPEAGHFVLEDERLAVTQRVMSFLGAGSQ